jgi:transposase-like protein
MLKLFIKIFQIEKTNIHLEDIDEIFHFLFDIKLINDVPPVSVCGQRFRIKKRTDSGDKFTWRCTSCLKTQSIKSKSFLEKFKFPLVKVLKLIYSWCLERKIVEIEGALRLSRPTILSFFQILRRC